MLIAKIYLPKDIDTKLFVETVFNTMDNIFYAGFEEKLENGNLVVTVHSPVSEKALLAIHKLGNTLKAITTKITIT